MLVLSRRLGESLVINGRRVLTVALLADSYVELSLIDVAGSLLGTFTAPVNEKIQITDDIEVIAIRLEGDKVRLGVVGPPESTFHRGEFWNVPM
jgi:sRNA-binding carbon storage regulator CsrA